MIFHLSRNERRERHSSLTLEVGVSCRLLMKKWILIMMFPIACLLFCGCNSASDSAPEQESVSEETAQEGAETEIDWSLYPTSKPAPETIIPDSVDVDNTATSLDSFVYEIREEGFAVITDFTGSETELVVTSQIGGYPVKEIGQYAFEASWNVTSVTLPDTLEIINEQAFADCESLTELNIPEGVTVIYRGAFSNCTALTELTLPASLTETKEEILTNCLSLTDLYVLNPNLEYVSWGLEDCESKCTIHAPAGANILKWAEANGFPTEIIEQNLHSLA